MATPGQKPQNEAVREPSKYGKHWSQGFFIALILSLGFWAPIYLEVNDKCADAWWNDFAMAFIAFGAFLSLSWLTCAISEYLEKRGRKNPGSR
jgi:hypothetical protein